MALHGLRDRFVTLTRDRHCTGLFDRLQNIEHQAVMAEWGFGAGMVTENTRWDRLLTAINDLRP
jgi:hypothetical protein